MTGAISRLANTHGSSWGKIRLTGEPREVFFNAASMATAKAFWDLQIGEEVVFDEEVDRTNGMRAINVRLATASPAI
jgi:hypothetical protein